MSRRLTIALTVSILAHGALLALFLWISLGSRRWAATLDERGGVVWFNLHPGGAGSGGEGGLGAPEPVTASAPQVQPAAPPSAAKPTVAPGHPKNPDESEAKPVRSKEKLRVAPAQPPAVASQPKATPAAPTGWAGPGTGDTAGTQTGPGGGQGEGLGGGEGAGSGGGKGPGGVGAPGTGGSGSGGEASALLAKIRQKIARAKRYPHQARAEGIEGVCGLSFEIQPDGGLAYVKLTQSSGSSLLDEEALATVRRAAPFPYYAGPIRFSLRFSLKDE
ncbi:MAG: energy transducer TonB [bacterium]